MKSVLYGQNYKCISHNRNLHDFGHVLDKAEVIYLVYFLPFLKREARFVTLYATLRPKPFYEGVLSLRKEFAPKWGLEGKIIPFYLTKEENLGEQILPFKVRPLFRRDT